MQQTFGEFLFYLQKYELWVYLLLVGAGLLTLRRVVMAWQEWRSAVFGMERDMAQGKLTGSLTGFGLLGLLMLAHFLLTSFLAPSYPKSSAYFATPTLDVLTTPTATLDADILAVSGTPSAATPMPTPSSNGCIAGQVEWLDPLSGAEVSGSVPIKGLVNVVSLGFFKYEYSAQGSDIWVAIAAGDQLAEDKTFVGTWNTADIPAGDYRLRLVVTDSQNVVLPACEIAVRVIAE